MLTVFALLAFACCAVNGTTPAERKAIVEFHNRIRSSVSPPAANMRKMVCAVFVIFEILPTPQDMAGFNAFEIAMQLIREQSYTESEQLSRHNVQLGILVCG